MRGEILGLETDLPPEAPSFITRVCGFGFHILGRPFGQAHRARGPHIARNGTFDPLLIAKYQRRFPEFDHKIVSMYARGMTTREIQGHIEEIYGFEASPA